MFRRISMRFPGSLPRLLACGLALGMTGCLFGGDQPPDPAVKHSGMLSKVGGWFGREKGKKKDKNGKAKTKVALPEPRKLPIGTVHLVQAEAGFVLIRTSRNTRIPADADLLTYDQSGRPTSKLRVSPERKGAFLAADILEGQPGPNDRVVMFGYVDGSGEDRFDLTNPGTDEVLE